MNKQIKNIMMIFLHNNILQVSKLDTNTELSSCLPNRSTEKNLLQEQKLLSTVNSRNMYFGLQSWCSSNLEHLKGRCEALLRIKAGIFQ